MIVCHDPRFVFLHVPRTGGVSLYAAVRTALPQAIILDGPTEMQTHCIAAEARRLWPDYPQFTILRNPWKIAASMWRMCRQGTADHVEVYLTHPEAIRLLTYSDLEFPDFVRRAVADGIWIPPGGFSAVYTDAGTRVFLFEDDPYRRIGDMLGVTLDMPWLNHCDGEDAVAWDDETIRLVGDQCRWDVERFGYRAPA